MSPLLVAAGAGIIFAALFLTGLVVPPQDPIVVLRARYLALSRLGRAEAEQELAERVEGLTRRYPGKAYSWYLSWLVRDLERAKDIR